MGKTKRRKEKQRVNHEKMLRVSSSSSSSSVPSITPSCVSMCPWHLVRLGVLLQLHVSLPLVQELEVPLMGASARTSEVRNKMRKKKNTIVVIHREVFLRKR